MSEAAAQEAVDQGHAELCRDFGIKILEPIDETQLAALAMRWPRTPSSGGSVFATRISPGCVQARAALTHSGIEGQIIEDTAERCGAAELRRLHTMDCDAVDALEFRQLGARIVVALTAGENMDVIAMRARSKARSLSIWLVAD